MKMKGTAMLFLLFTTVLDYDTLCKVLWTNLIWRWPVLKYTSRFKSERKATTRIFTNIFALGIVEDESVIRYIADGFKFRDDLSSTSNMMKSNIQRKQAGKPKKRFDQKQNQSQRHCFNCGSTEHMRDECKEETKCFKCNGGGHTSRNCPGEKRSTKKVWHA